MITIKRVHRLITSTQIYKQENIAHTTIPAYNNLDIGETIEQSYHTGSNLLTFTRKKQKNVDTTYTYNKYNDVNNHFTNQSKDTNILLNYLPSENEISESSPNKSTNHNHSYDSTI